MALVTTRFGPASNSYVTLEEAEDRIAEQEYDSSLWGSLSSTAKEECLILATRVIDRLPLRGKKVNRYIPAGTYYSFYTGAWTTTEEQHGQALAFPRTVQENREEVPDDVKEAQIDIAATIVAPIYPSASDATSSAQKKDISMVTLGSLSVRFKDTPTRSPGGFRMDDLVLLSSTVVALKLQRYLTAIRGARVDTTEDDILEKVDDYVSLSSSSTSLSSSSSSSSALP